MATKAGKSRNSKAVMAPAPVRAIGWAPLVLFVACISVFLVPPLPNQALGLDIVAMWVGATGAGAALLLLFVRKPEPGLSLSGAAFIAFMAWALLGALASGRVWPALVGESTNRFGWMTLVCLAAIAWAASRWAPEVTWLLRRHAWWIVLLESLFALFRLMLTNDLAVGGTLPNSTYLGEAFLLLLAWIPPDTDTPPWQKRYRSGTIALAIFTLAVVQSRAALLVATLWLLWTFLRAMRASLRLKVSVVLAVMTVAVVALISFMPAGVLGPNGSVPFGGRLAAWGQAGAATLKRPVLGWGADGYWPAAASVRTIEAANAGHSLLLGPGATDPHNFLVWVGVSTGTVGLLLWLWFGLETARAWARSEARRTVAPAAWSLAAVLAVGLTAPIPLHISLLFALIVGVGFGAASASAAVSERRFEFPGWVPVAAASLALLVALVFSLNAMTRAMYQTASQQRSPAIAADAASASSLWAADPYLAYLSSLHAGWAAATDPQAGWAAADMEALDRALRLDRRNPFYALERARASIHYGGTPEQVDAAFAEAFERYPAYPLARAEYARYLAANGRPDDARQQLEIISAIDDDDPSRAKAVQEAQSLLVSPTPEAVQP